MFLSSRVSFLFCSALACALSAQTQTVHLTTDSITPGAKDSISIVGSTLRWIRVADAGPDSSVTLPFSEPADLRDFGQGRIIATGLDATTNLAHILRIELSLPGGVPLISVVEDLALGSSIRADSIAYSSLENGLVMLDRAAKKFRYIPWSPWGPLSQPITFVGQSTNVLDPPFVMRKAELGEVSGSVYCDGAATWLASLRPGEARASTTKYRPHTVVGAWMLEETVTPYVPVQLTPVSAGWAVQGADIQADIGDIILSAFGGGSFSIVRQSDMVSVQAGSIATGQGWVSVPLVPNALAVGESYRIDGVGQDSSKIFYPSFRRGLTVSADDMSMDPGRIPYLEMVEGNSDFTVRGMMRWIGVQEPGASVIPYFLWIAVGKPSQSTISDLGNGVMIVIPTTTIVGEDWRTILKVPGYMPISQVVSLPDNASGETLLFQWVGVGAQGNVFVSDVFGYTIGDAPVAAAAVAGGGGQTPRERLKKKLFAMRNQSAWASRHQIMNKLAGQ